MSRPGWIYTGAFTEEEQLQIDLALARAGFPSEIDPGSIEYLIVTKTESGIGIGTVFKDVGTHPDANALCDWLDRAARRRRS